MPQGLAMSRILLHYLQAIPLHPLSSLSCFSLALLGTIGEGSVLAASTTSAVKTYEVQAIKDIAYYEGDEAHQAKHKLDLFLPKDRKEFPVLFFVHGGGWRTGDKNFFGIYSALGTFFAKHGIGTVVINYRLSPEVMHPEHIKDVARAFAWTHKNIGNYGGRNDEIFACGHSAGGHLVALLATDPTYLKAVGLNVDAIKGVIPISGVFFLPDGLFEKVFGKDSEARKNAFPLNHVRSGLPPFLILYADSDFPGCDMMSEKFAKAVRACKGAAETLEIKKSNHLSIIGKAALEGDPVTRALLNFIGLHVETVGRQVKAKGME